MISYKKVSKRETAGFFMARINSFSKYLLVAVIAGWSFPVLAAGDGYEGLFAPSHDDKQDSAPAPKATEQPGYMGLTQAPPPATNSPPRAAEEGGLATNQPAPPLQYTPSPLSPNMVLPDLGMAAAAYGKHPEVKAPQVDYSKVKHSLIDGKPPIVYLTDTRIAQAMALVNNKDLSRDERDKNAKTTFKNLSRMADGLRLRQTMPDSIYKSMHLSDTYIKEERDGDIDALKKLEAAIETLKPLQ